MNASHPTPGPGRSVSARFLRWLFSWKTLRRTLLLLAGLLTLIALLVTEENWRGKRAWEQYKKDWEARGERFDLASFMPKPVPDDQNFVMTRFFAPLLERERRLAAGSPKGGVGASRSELDVYGGQAVEAAYKKHSVEAPQSELDVYGGQAAKGPASFGHFRKATLTDLQEWQKFYRANTNFPSAPQPQPPAKDVLFALEKFGPVLSELREASGRRYAQFPLYEPKGPAFALIHLTNLKSLATVFRLRAAAFLADGQSGEALADVKVIFRLADSLKPEPFLISHLVRLSILELSVSCVWEGLARHQWAEPDLLELQRLIGATDLFTDYQHVLRGERAASNQLLAWMRSGHGGELSGLLYQNQIRLDRAYQVLMLPLIDASGHRAYPEQSNPLTNAPEFRTRTPYNFVARMLLPAMAKSAAKTAGTQAALDQALVACALERFRLATGQYPADLQALVPRFIEQVPRDVINGDPLHYRRTDDGQFLLYSVGWDRKDDGALSVVNGKQASAPDGNRNDWVWRYPAELQR